MLKSVNRENDYFSNNLWNIKNTVDKVNKNVTLYSAHKVKVSTIQIFEIIIILRLLKIILTEIMPTNYLKVPTTLYGGSQINTPQNVPSKTEYNHGTGSSALTQVAEKPKNKIFISKYRYPSSNLENFESSYFSNKSNRSINKAPLKHICKKFKLT